MYQIPFVLKTKKIIINVIKNKLDEFSNFNVNKEVNDKIEYVLAKIADSKYYYTKIKLKYIVEYNKTFLFESKEDDIKIIEDNLKSNKLYKIEKYLTCYENAKKFNERFSLIKYLFEQKSKNIEYSNIELKNEWENLEQKIKKKKFEEIPSNDIMIINNFLKYNEELFINIFNKDIYKCLITKIQNINNNNHSRNSISTNVSLDNNNKKSLDDEESETNDNIKENANQKLFNSKENINKNNNQNSLENDKKDEEIRKKEEKEKDGGSNNSSLSNESIAF